MYYYKVLLFASALTYFKCALACHAFDNVEVTAFEGREGPLFFTVNGCIERIAFLNHTLTKIEMVGQNVPRLERDSVRHMSKLQEISFRNSRIEVIEPGFLRNVPRLVHVDISSNKIQEVPRRIFNGTVVQRLNLSVNRIDTIFDFAFEDMHALKSLDLSRNKLQYWNRNWFKNVDALSLLNFKQNSIAAIPRQAFVNAPNVKNVSLDFNEISVISRDAFKGLRHLEELGLRYNLIQVITADVFPFGFGVTLLDIRANRLNFLPEDLLARFSVERVVVDGNPWKCACLDKIKQWIKQAHGRILPSNYCDGLHIPECVDPEEPLCAGIVDVAVTTDFINGVGKINKHCVRLD